MAMEVDCPFDWFTRCLHDSSLPGEPHAAGPFDNRADFELGDPGANFEGNNKCEYATSGEVGEPHWSKLFQYLLAHFAHVRWLHTVFVLVENRDLTSPRTEQVSLAHWPTLEAWWTSRLALHGPARELCDLLFVPIDQTAGLEHVHPTWGGTFVLSALVFLFPGVHIVLLDSDCVPVTLFEVADLWKEFSLLQNGLTRAAATSSQESQSAASEESAPKASKLSRDRWHHQVIGQGVLLVTEHNAEINAGFIVAFASSHKTSVQEDRWRRISDASLLRTWCLFRMKQTGWPIYIGSMLVTSLTHADLSVISVLLSALPGCSLDLLWLHLQGASPSTLVIGWLHGR